MSGGEAANERENRRRRWCQWCWRLLGKYRPEPSEKLQEVQKGRCTSLLGVRSLKYT